MNEPLLELEDVTIEYTTSDGTITAASSVSFTLEEQEYFGLVGESGCGKTTVMKSILGGLDDNGHVSSGRIIYKGKEINNLSEDKLNEEIRWTEIAYIPQGAMNSLDPLQKMSEKALEIAHNHSDMSKKQALDKFKEMFSTVGLPEERIHDYPHQFSGGMKQRVIIALALFLEPDLIMADEPTTALDVIMQDQVFSYLDDISKNIGSSMVLITHDMGVVFESCEKVGVMHAGQLSEVGSPAELYNNPSHPYTILLKRSFPELDNLDKKLLTVDGNPPQLTNEANFCTFVDRCPWAKKECHETTPKLEPVENGSHRAACLRKEMVKKDIKNGVHTIPGEKQ